MRQDGQHEPMMVFGLTLKSRASSAIPAFTQRQEGTICRGRTARGKTIISRLPLHEEVADHLREMIISGDLAGGKKVRLNDLSEELGVSFTPLREALKVMAAERLVELTPNRGARVALLDVDETRALFEVMSGIEALAAELCRRADDAR